MPRSSIWLKWGLQPADTMAPVAALQKLIRQKLVLLRHWSIGAARPHVLQHAMNRSQASPSATPVSSVIPAVRGGACLTMKLHNKRRRRVVKLHEEEKLRCGGEWVGKEQCTGAPVWGRSGEEEKWCVGGVVWAHEERCGVRSDGGHGGHTNINRKITWNLDFYFFFLGTIVLLYGQKTQWIWATIFFETNIFFIFF